MLIVFSLYRLSLNVQKYNTSQYFTIYHDTLWGTPIPISPPTAPYPALRTDACAPNVEVLLLNTSFFVFTQSAYAQSQLVSFSDPTLVPFLDVLPMHNGTLVLTAGAAYYLPANTSSPRIATQGLPADITSIHASANCDYLLGSAGEGSALNYVVFAWDDSSPVTTIYVSQDDGQNFTALDIGIPAPGGAGWRVRQVTFSQSYPRYVLAAIDAVDSTNASLLVYDYTYATWSQGAALPLALATADDLEMEVPVTGAGVLYVWPQGSTALAQDVYYSADGGITLFPTSDLPSDIALASLVSLDTSPFGSFAFLTSNSSAQNIVREMADTPVFAVSPVSTTDPIEVNFDSFGDPRVLSLTTLGVTSTSSPLTSTDTSLPPCPFLHMETDQFQLHYIDMGENFTLAITLVTAATSAQDTNSPAVSVSVSDTNLLGFNLSFLGAFPLTPPTTFSQALVVNENDPDQYTNYTERLEFATGSTDVRITAKDVTPPPPSLTLFFYLFLF
jgi:hypothetical protein